MLDEAGAQVGLRDVNGPKIQLEIATCQTYHGTSHAQMSTKHHAVMIKYTDSVNQQRSLWRQNIFWLLSTYKDVLSLIYTQIKKAIAFKFSSL